MIRSARASVDAVLQYAWDADSFTSNDVMPAVGLTRSTTIEAIDELIDRQLVAELPNARASGDYRKGRPARRFAFRPDAGYVIGVDAGRTHLIAAVADLRGAVVLRRGRELSAEDDTADGRRRALEALLHETVRDAGIDPARIVAVCAGVPAPVDRDGQSPADHAFWARMNPGLREVFARWAPAVRIENDASLAAVAEGARGAAVGCRNYIALLAGDRLGSGVVLDGHLLRGAHGGTGELIPFDHVEGVGSVDGLGMTVARWAREAIEAGDIPSTHPLARIDPEQLTALAVFRAARDGDAAAAAIIARAGEVVARIAAVFGGFFDPERIIFCGAVADSVEVALAPARALLAAQMHLPPPQLIASTLGADVVVIGAVAGAVASARTILLGAATARATAANPGER